MRRRERRGIRLCSRQVIPLCFVIVIQNVEEHFFHSAMNVQLICVTIILLQQIQEMYFANPPIEPDLEFYKEVIRMLIKYNDRYVVSN